MAVTRNRRESGFAWYVIGGIALSNVETGTYGAVNYGLLLAGAVIAMVPCVIVYVALQRYYVRGLVSGALKG
jgi:multiple sugar transport system permease protein